MSHDTYELKAEAREQVGKGSARAVRRDGKVPAVIYGDKQPPLAIALSYKDIYYKIHGGGFLTTVATIDVGGKRVIDGQTGTSISRNPVFGFKMKGAKVGDKVVVNWVDNKGDKRTDEATVA